MTPELPSRLRMALERSLEGVSRKELAERAAKTSEAYRAGRPSAGVIREPGDALAYALTRLPATYAAAITALAEAARMAPDFSPSSLLDAGVGTGAASWAALQVWPALAAITWLDANPPFLALAADLAGHAPPALKHAEARRVDLVADGPWPRAELVIVSYALAEIAPSDQISTLNELWSACDGVLVLIEPGTPRGYARILAARTHLRAAGAELIAPCPHEAPCPLIGQDWCHFSVRLPRSRDHRIAKGAEAPFEDERFSYLLAARPGIKTTSRAARVLAPPKAAKPGLALKLCGLDGQVEQRLVAKRDKAAYALARRTAWGETL